MCTQIEMQFIGGQRVFLPLPQNHCRPDGCEVGISETQLAGLAASGLVEGINVIHEGRHNVFYGPRLVQLVADVERKRAEKMAANITIKLEVQSNLTEEELAKLPVSLKATAKVA